ncbi:LPP20 family lipoprotein [Motiliproteus sp. SC1-56]|uniref:LPP20 family lipoprotein n=1 Tax=Motiliproteus sp. SC1-56 TaxID=2799565 RepID=UPI001A9091F9|nr:LPP20 family lipoprotein [Motiliproteus sp. SC1-56]
MLDTRPVRNALLLLLVLAGAGCGTSPLPPWQQSTESYPPERYLRADGSAQDPNDAQRRALANLAQIFQLHVEDRGLDFVQSQSARDEDPEVIRRSRRIIAVSGEQVIEGARIAEQWQAKDGRHYALAVLEKAPAAFSLGRRIADLDGRLAQQMRAASAAPPLAAIPRLEQARHLQREREALARKLEVLEAAAPPPPYSQGEIESALETQLGQLQLRLEVPDPALHPLLESAAESLGISTSPQSPTLLQAELLLEPTEWESGWYWRRGALQLTLSGPETVLASRRWPIKAAARNRAYTDTRLVNTLSNALPGYLYELLAGSNAESRQHLPPTTDPAH